MVIHDRNLRIQEFLRSSSFQNVPSVIWDTDSFALDYQGCCLTQQGYSGIIAQDIAFASSSTRTYPLSFNDRDNPFVCFESY